jgi:hypothetical protein
VQDTLPDEGQIHGLTDEIKELVKELRQRKSTNNNEFHVIHKADGASTLSIICAAIAVCALLATLGIAWVVNMEQDRQGREISDLRAWKDLHQNYINDVKIRVSNLENRGPK